MTLIASQAPTLLLQTVTFTACTASDTFAAVQGQKYALLYVNGATQTSAASYVSEKAAVAPSGSVPVVPATPATKFSDGLLIASTFPATSTKWSEFIVDNYLAGGVVTLLHGGTLTTLTVAILGPL